ncbi:hypothetical protein [Rhodothermus bifroesti]|uniref:Uncharacterized protein n=1 Tax=Rhodothermus marinus TaxID=29549 RepID=A0A7V2F768_RHOMR|nr:hypothetical protein [Rhodothermus bifroesti]GBD00481.1 hypothetical protein HRbin18_00190 [bacterium HR18]
MGWVYWVALGLMVAGSLFAWLLLRYANRQASSGGRGYRLPRARRPRGPRRGADPEPKARALSRDRRPVRPRF